MIKQLPLGDNPSLGVDDTSTKDGVPVAYYNCYRDSADALRSIPGCELYVDLGTGQPVYGWHSKLKDRVVFVSGGKVFIKLSDSSSVVEVTGASLTTNEIPSFTEDRDSIFVAANSKIHRIKGAYLDILAQGPDNVTSIIFISGFLVANGGSLPGDANFSDDGPGNVGALTGDYENWEVYNNEAMPDSLDVLILLQNIYVYNFGPTSLEVTYVGSDPNNPFEINKGRQSNFGVLAPKTALYDGESIYFLSIVEKARKLIKMPGGDAPQVISFGVDIPIENFERVDDAYAYTMAFRGQNFYMLHFPTANTVVDEQYYEAITLAWHIQKNCWRIFGKWNSQRSGYEAYRGSSFVFAESWGRKLLCGNDGKVYSLIDSNVGSYSTEVTFQHRWRDDNQVTWQLPRSISLGKKGSTTRPHEQYRCGTYRKRQHEFSFSNSSDAGELFRMAVKSGRISYGMNGKKRASMYRYDARTGINEMVLNMIEEEITPLEK